MLWPHRRWPGRGRAGTRWWTRRANLLRGVGSVEGAVGSEAGVVDQQVDGPVTELAQQGENAIIGRKVGRDEGDRAVPGTGNDALADLLEPIMVAAGKHEVETAFAKALSEDGAEAGGGAGYDSHRGGDTRR